MRSTLVLLLMGCFTCVAAAGENHRDDAAWKALHRKAVDRQRRIIFNNDGNEPVYHCKAGATAEELLRQRTSPLAGSQVDAIFYCTWSSGFGLFTHNTRVGQVFNTREEMFEANRTQEFLNKGIDPLEVMIDFAHEHGMELFWSMRMNDTHDGSRAAYGPVMFRANRLKQEHPEWLIGSKDNPPKYGAWSAVDFGVAEIRDLAFRYCEEICQNYTVDGIELDFFRHAFFFKCSGFGEPCGPEELNHMTELMRRIRTMTEQTGRQRGRPILLAVRVPDSVEYCRHIGIDLERWLADGLVDLLVVSGYTQLNCWEYSVQLGHRYGVKVYPSLDEPRIRDEAARKLRGSLAAYRGRALNVWSAGGDGIYMFNYFNPRSPLWRELGDPETLRKLDRYYFSSVRGPGHMPVPHREFIRVPVLNPGNPITIRPQETASVEFQAGESFNDNSESTCITLHLLFKPMREPQHLRAMLNRAELSAAEVGDGWLAFVLPEGSLRKGANTLELSVHPGQTEMCSLLDLYLEVDHP